jgi:hypothetical protein
MLTDYVAISKYFVILGVDRYVAKEAQSFKTLERVKRRIVHGIM